MKAGYLRPVTCDPLEIGHFPYEKGDRAWQKSRGKGSGGDAQKKPAADERIGRLLYCLSDRARRGFAPSAGSERARFGNSTNQRRGDGIMKGSG